VSKVIADRLWRDKGRGGTEQKANLAKGIADAKSSAHTQISSFQAAYRTVWKEVSVYSRYIAEKFRTQTEEAKVSFATKQGIMSLFHGS
jgi:hypothetical protein